MRHPSSKAYRAALQGEPLEGEEDLGVVEDGCCSSPSPLGVLEDAVEEPGEAGELGSPGVCKQRGSPSSSSSSSSSSSTSSSTSTTSSSGSPSKAPDVVQEEAAGGAEGSWPSSIEGGVVTVEDRRDTWGYRRLILRCSYHPSCSRRRNTNLTSNLGEREPEAFLACWHLAGAQCSKDAHKNVRPSVADQRAWLARHGSSAA